ncbi:hypothetical protein DXG01_003387 [Tephrocybe rancida]|nr:hypothetical protein DXG01_003387 [Tephrocybe rancida]
MPRAPKSSKTQESNDTDDIDEGIIIDDLQAPPPAQECPVPQRKTTAPVTAAPGTDTEDEGFISARSLKKRLPKSPSDFEATSAEEQQCISRLHPTKCPISQEELDEEDDCAFYKEIEAKAKAKAKKEKGKARDDNGPFKSGPIPDEVKERLYAIHADFKRKRKKPDDMLKEDWTKIIAFEYDKYCDNNLGPLSKDPDACTKLMKPMLEWYTAKYRMYTEEKKTDRTFKKVIVKAQQDFVHLAKLNHKYNRLHCFGFIINLQPDHTNCTFSSMWGATPTFERMKVTEKGVISCQITDWEGMLRVAQLQLNAKDDEDTKSKNAVEKQLWSVLDPGSLVKCDNNRKTFLAWLGNDIGQIRHACGEPLEKCHKIMMPWATWPDYAYKDHLCLVNWPRNARAPDGLKKGRKPYDYKDASNGLLQSDINPSNWKCGDYYLDECAIQIVSWGDDEMKLNIEGAELPTLPFVMNTDNHTIVCVDSSPKFNHDLAEAKKQHEHPEGTQEDPEGGPRWHLWH